MARNVQRGSARDECPENNGHSIVTLVPGAGGNSTETSSVQLSFGATQNFCLPCHAERHFKGLLSFLSNTVVILRPLATMNCTQCTKHW